MTPQRTFSNAQYKTLGGEVCPFCESRKLSARPCSKGPGRLKDFINCDDCRKEWQDAYDLSDITSLRGTSGAGDSGLSAGAVNEYLANAGTRCPYCHSDALASLDVTGKRAEKFIAMRCRQCAGGWVETYTFVGLVSAEPS